MRIRILEFDGTAEDYLKVRPALGESTSQAPAGVPPPASVDNNGSGSEPEVTSILVERVLTRRYLSPSARRVFKALLDAGSNGLNTSEMARSAGINRAELAGVFGAFGRRVANTEGWPKDKSFVDAKRDDEREGEWRYSLPPVVRSVLESGRIKL